MTRPRTTRKLQSALSSLVLIVAAAGSSGDALAGDGVQQDVVHQLRTYQIFDATRQRFHDRFRDHAMRIMARYDFNIVATWETRSDDRIEFVYLLEWPDEATMRDRWTRFMADREWVDIKQRTRIHGPMVGEIRDQTLLLTAYSPNRALAGAGVAEVRP
jgi:hypothetical protein